MKKLLKLALVGFLFVITLMIVASFLSREESNSKTFSSTKSAPQYTIVPTLNPQPEQIGDISVTIKNDNYTISGNNVDDVWDEIREHGPKNDEGDSYTGYTYWYIHWNYEQSNTAKGCKATDITVPVEVTFTMPHLKPTAETPNDVIVKWNTFMKNLQQHENGHKDIAIEAAQEIYDTLQTLPAATTCRALGLLVDKKARTIIDTYKQKEKKYDKDTNHGETQGAYFRNKGFDF